LISGASQDWDLDFPVSLGSRRRLRLGKHGGLTIFHDLLATFTLRLLPLLGSCNCPRINAGLENVSRSGKESLIAGVLPCLKRLRRFA